MYEIFECLHCGHIFDMTDEGRKYFTKTGGCIIKCPECECLGLEPYDMKKQRSGCLSFETKEFTSCDGCFFEYSNDCNDYRRVSRVYQILTVTLKETVWKE